MTEHTTPSETRTQQVRFCTRSVSLGAVARDLLQGLKGQGCSGPDWVDHLCLIVCLRDRGFVQSLLFEVRSLVESPEVLGACQRVRSLLLFVAPFIDVKWGPHQKLTTTHAWSVPMDRSSDGWVPDTLKMFVLVRYCRKMSSLQDETFES